MSQRMTAEDNKLNAIPVVLLACCLALGLYNQPASADTDPLNNIVADYVAPERLPASDSKRVVGEVMASEGLNQEKKVMVWRLIETPEEQNEHTSTPEWLKTIAGVLAKLVEFTLWIVIALAIIALYVFRKHWLPLLDGKPRNSSPERPDILFGMDVREDSLPSDVLAAAHSLWQEGKPRDALSLLYRSALVTLINREQLALKHSHTEGDILKLSQSALATRRQHYFQQLTQQWVQIAYAHESPTEADMQYLLDHWQSDFVSDSSEAAQ